MAKSFAFNPLSGNFDIISEVTLAAVGAVPNANGASISAAQVLTLQPADATHPGALTAADWNTFNSKQAAGNYITALTGDATASGPGSAALTLATVNSNVGSFGSASNTLTATANAKGLITAIAATAIQIAESQVTNLVSDLAAKQSTTLTNAHILVGNVSNVATDVAVTGDVTISNAGVTAIGANKVSNAMLRQSSGLSLIGRSANTTGDVADITAASDNQIMRRSGTAIGFGSIDLSQSNAVGATVLGVANGGTGQVTTTAAFQALSVLTTKGDILVYGTNTTRLAVGTDGQTLVADSTAGAGVKWGAAGFPQVVAIKDSQTSSTTGGGFNSGAWRTRTLNTLDNPLSYAWVTLSSNQFTLTTGTYYIRASAPGFTVDRHQIKIRNITDSSDTILGQGAMCAASDASQSSAALSGAFTIAGTKTFELQHQCQTSNATNGFGLAMNFSVNSIFGEVEVIKLA